jgi:hypothetical protein
MLRASAQASSPVLEWCCVELRKCDKRMAEQRQWRSRVLRTRAALAYTAVTFNHTPGNAPAMTRTPIITVTANAFAARAFAWGISIGAHFSDLESGTPPPLH